MPTYVPKVHYNPSIEQILVPNKNIQSYFMKSECSYFVKENERFSECKKEEDAIITIFITPDDLIIGMSMDECVVLTNNREKYEHDANSEIDTEDIENEEKYTQENATQEKISQEKYTQEKSTQEKFTQESQKNNFNFENQIFQPITIIEDKDFFKKLYECNNFNKKSFSSLMHLQNFIETRIREIYSFNYKSAYINLIFNDLLTRTEILCLVDLFVKLMGCKGVMLLPYSLVCCFGFNIASATVLVKHKEYVSLCFIEDNCWIDGNFISINKDSKQIDVFYDSQCEDFVEEFSKQRFNIGNRSYFCKFCDVKTENSVKMVLHLKEIHINEINEDNDDSFSEYYTEKQEDKIKIENYNLKENFIALLNSNFDTEKAKKIGSNVFLIGFKQEDLNFKDFDFEIKLRNDFSAICAIRGAFAFVNLDCAKEMWLTDKEWESAGLRILKEKLLFYI